MKKFVVFFMLFFILIPSICFAIEIDCPNAVLIDASNGRVIYSKDAYTKVPPASTTKVMTALIVLERARLDSKATASYDAIMSVPSGGSNTAIQVGESLTIEQLLNCMLVASGNEAANVLAEYISGSKEAFVDLMNQRALELGCNNTHFVNPNGLSDEGHYSCAYDLAIIYKYAFDNFETFREIVQKTSYSLPTSEKYKKEDRKFTNTNKLIIPSETSPYYYVYCTGGKTGYTSEAKNCLVSSASKDGKRLVCAVLGGSQDEKKTSQRFQDTVNLFNYGFDNLQVLQIVNPGTIVATVEVQNAKEEDSILPLHTKQVLQITASVDDSLETFESQVNISGDIIAPVSSGDVIGTITFNAYGIDYTLDLYAVNDVTVKPPNPVKVFFDTFGLWIFRIIIIGGIAIFFLRFYNIVIRKKSTKSRIMATRKYNSRFHH